MLTKIKSGLGLWKIKHKYGRWKYQQLSRKAIISPVKSLEAVRLLQEELAAEGYSSQCGQDKWIVETLFPGKQSGVFVDIGANDGLKFSNTAYLEKKMGWTGLAVEPIPEVFDKLRANRSCATVNACVGAENGEALFRSISGYSEMLSGLIHEYDKNHLQRIDREIQEHQCQYRDIKMRCYTINSLLEEHGLWEVDYLNIDVEGAEVSIISKLDPSRFHISVIGIENNYQDHRIPQILNAKGYRMHSIVGDEFYVHQEFMRL